MKLEIGTWEEISFKNVLYTQMLFSFFLESKGENWHMQILLPDFPMTDYSWWTVHKRAKLTVKAH